MSLRRSIRLALAAPAVAVALGSTLLAASPAHALTGAEEIAFLNAQRVANGLPGGITEVPEWSDGCAKHMAYLRTNNRFEHDEDPALPGYTPEGDAAGNASVLTSGGASFSPTGVNAFEQAPIHLMQMLSPFLQRSGAADGCLATLRDIARPFAAPVSFSYPGEGGVVAARERAYEGPFVPGAFVGLAEPGRPTNGLQTGPHLYFFNAGPGGYSGSRGRITAATLNGPAGPVEVRTVDNATSAPLGALGSYLAPGGIVIPVAPLQPLTTYTASVSFQPTSGAAVQRTWSFSTAPGFANSGGGSGGQPGAGGAAESKPTPTPVPPPSPRPPDLTPSAGHLLAVSTLRLRSRSLTFVASADARIWVTIERRARTVKGKVRWKRIRSFAVNAEAGAVTRAAHGRLPRGTYRVRLRATRAGGTLVLERTVPVR